MPKIQGQIRRKPVKKSYIVSQIRQQIMEGELLPGSRLPSREALEAHFQSSPVTVQNALNRLVSDGFVRVHARRATFVADFPPHLTRYGIVFPSHPLSTTEWSRFFAAIGVEVMRLQGEGLVQFPIYYGITDQQQGEDFAKLEHDIKSSRLAGLIFVAHAFSATETPLVANSGLPCVSVIESRASQIPRVRLDRCSFIDKALDDLQSRGCRQLAVICLHSWLQRDSAYLIEALAKRGMTTNDYWLQSVNNGSAEAVRNCANLLMRSRQWEPFDAVLIADDNLVEQTIAGFLAAGNCNWNELTLIAHGNFPSAELTTLPIRRLGFDSRQILKECVAIIKDQREGREVSQNTFIPALFEEELPRNSAVEITEF